MPCNPAYVVLRINSLRPLRLSITRKTCSAVPVLTCSTSLILSCVPCTLRGVRPIIISAERRGKRRASCVPLANEPVR